jgi:ferritin-like protein
MADVSSQFHEDPRGLDPGTLDRHRALASIIEELEAADWYDQRAEAATDDALRDIVAHNRDEEKEHAAMLLEWLRRRDPTLDAHLRRYLFTEAPITAIEAVDQPGAGTPAAPAPVPGDGSLGIGGLHREARRAGRALR